MKLHLPVCLFRIIVALLAGLSSTLYAEYAAPIYGEEYSILSLNDEHSVTYSGYDVVGSGGAICGLEYSSIILNDSVKVTFSENSATVDGGAINVYDGSSIILSNNGKVSFSENFAQIYGGAIYGDVDSTLTLSYNGDVTFSGNSSSGCGGAICGWNDNSIILRDNGTVTFNGNSATVYGGAIYGHDGSTIILSDNRIVTFSGNTASSGGSAICGSGGNTVTLSNNGTVTFSGNSGRAISVSTTALNGNSSVMFSENSGGAIAGAVTMSGNGEVSFSGNSSGSNGGAIAGAVTMSGNDEVSFSGNLVSRSGYANGGAIYGDVTLSDSGRVIFSENSVSSSSASAYGGAIYGDVTLSGNAEVTFCENKASSSDSDYSRGGAIYGSGDTLLKNNGSVIFSGNSSDLGGAIYGIGDITLGDNGSVVFRGNSSMDCGGAICSGLVLSIRNNDSVLFEQNVEVKNGTYRLRSIYNSAGVGSVVSLSAAEEKSLEFRDSVYIGGSGKVELNADYTDAKGVVHKQQGDIIFTGKYTETHLNEILKAAEVERTATAEEIANSRTTSVKSNTYLYGGRLRIEDGAILGVDYLIVADNSHATLLLKDGTIEGNKGLYGTNCRLTIGATGTLSLSGENIIRLGNRDLTMADGSCLRMELGAVNMDGNAVLSTTGTLNMDYITFVLADSEYLETGKYKLLTRTEGTDYDISGWSLQGAAANQLTWENGTLYYTGGHDWNHVVKGGDEVQDSYTGNLIVKDGSVTLDSSVTVNAVDGVEKTGHLVVDKEANLTVTAESSVRAEVIVKDGTLHNEGSMEASITLMGGKVFGSGVFAGIDMIGGKLVVGNSPGMQRYTDTVNLSGGTVVFSVAGVEAASAGNSGWGSGTYSTLDMQGNILTFGEDVTIEVAFGGEGLVSVLTATDANPYTLQMELAQNVGNAAAYTQEVLEALASQTTFVVTEETSGIAGCITLAPGQSLADMVKSYSYSMSGDTLVLSVTLAGNGKGVVAVPEPTTATLSLLVLAALAARRRRK